MSDDQYFKKIQNKLPKEFQNLDLHEMLMEGQEDLLDMDQELLEGDLDQFQNLIGKENVQKI
jgi:hypothetical protein